MDRNDINRLVQTTSDDPDTFDWFGFEQDIDRRS